MPDRRQHRGPHPHDYELFNAAAIPRLRAAAGDLSWLLSRGYAVVSSTKLVGDRYQLDARQRLAVVRCACSDEQLARRQAHQIDAVELQGSELWLDGYNVLTTIEAAISGGVILAARDGCFRDMASMHGSYRKVQETLPALTLLGEQIAQLGVQHCRWLLDEPVSNSGRLRAIIQELAASRGWDVEVQLVHNPDNDLMASDAVVASADSQIIDACERWFNLARVTIENHLPRAWIVDLAGEQRD